MHICSSGIYFAAASIRRLSSSFVSKIGFFEVIIPITTYLSFGRNLNGAKSPEGIGYGLLKMGGTNLCLFALNGEFSKGLENEMNELSIEKINSLFEFIRSDEMQSVRIQGFR